MTEFKKGDRVRVLSSTFDRHNSKTGTVVNHVAVGSDPILRVRIDGGTETEYVEVDGTAEKFELLGDAFRDVLLLWVNAWRKPPQEQWTAMAHAFEATGQALGLAEKNESSHEYHWDTEPPWTNDPKHRELKCGKDSPVVTINDVVVSGRVAWCRSGSCGMACLYVKDDQGKFLIDDVTCRPKQQIVYGSVKVEFQK